MSASVNDIFVDNDSVDGNVPEGFLAAQRLLDVFVNVAYDAVYPNMSIYTPAENAVNLVEFKRQVMKLISGNPPLQTVPAYYKDGRENYLWYSDFFDDAGKEVFRRYALYVPAADKITPANYAEKLSDINLPYFRELVGLVGLLKTIDHIECRMPYPEENAEPELIQSAEAVTTQFEEIVTIESEPTLEAPKPLRSYQPNMTTEQYSLLVKCINHLEMFRSNIKVATLRELFEGKAAHTFQVTNQKRLTYLFDQLAEHKFIKKSWATVATENRNFISARRRDVEAPDKELHYISRQQFANSRLANKSEWINGLEEIDDLIETMAGK